MRTHGEPGWEDYPSYLDVFIPRVLGLLKQIDLKITFFIVGKDATLAKNKEYLAQLTAEGHEVGNHSFLHEQWFSKFSRERVKQEIESAEKAIVEVTGQRPVGFRSPGYGINGFHFEVLIDLGYLYDTSSLPTFLGPLARAYYFKTAVLDDEEKNKRKDLFGGFKNGLKPIKPYLLESSPGHQILEIPVTSVPLLKIPFHLSYLIYIARHSEELMKLYLNFAILSCKISRTPLNFLLHPLDLMGKEDAPGLAFFPGMDMTGEKKKQIFLGVLQTLMKHFQLVRMSVLAKHILQHGDIKVVHDYRFL